MKLIAIGVEKRTKFCQIFGEELFAADGTDLRGWIRAGIGTGGTEITEGGEDLVSPSIHALVRLWPTNDTLM